MMPFGRGQSEAGAPEKMPRGGSEADAALAASAGMQDAVDQRVEVGVVDREAVQPAEEEDRARDLFVGEGLRVSRELAASDRSSSTADGSRAPVGPTVTSRYSHSSASSSPACSSMRLIEPSLARSVVLSRRHRASRSPRSEPVSMAPACGLTRPGLHCGDDHVAFGGPAAVKGGLGCLGAARDLFERDAVVARVGEHLEHGREDLALADCVAGAAPGA